MPMYDMQTSLAALAGIGKECVQERAVPDAAVLMNHFIETSIVFYRVHARNDLRCHRGENFKFGCSGDRRHASRESQDKGKNNQRSHYWV